jgi:TetR/AcrR family transcriptional regulator, transcriptional repressor of aconitase
MPKISEEQRQARREQILAAAWRCFARHGLHATSMEEIIREADLSAGAVYLYYKSKDELILAAISSYMARLRDLLLPILARPDPLPPLEFIHEITSAIANFTRRPGLDLNAIILICWSEAQTNTRVKKLISGFQVNYRAALAGVIAQWQKRKELPPRGNPADIAKAFHSLFLGFIAGSALMGDLDPKTITSGMRGLLSK